MESPRRLPTVWPGHSLILPQRHPNMDGLVFCYTSEPHPRAPRAASQPLGHYCPPPQIFLDIFSPNYGTQEILIAQGHICHIVGPFGEPQTTGMPEVVLSPKASFHILGGEIPPCPGRRRREEGGESEPESDFFSETHLPCDY